MNKKSGFTLVNLILIIITVMIAMLAGCGVLLIKGCFHVQNVGVKNIGEQLWNGTNAVPSTNNIH